MSGARTVTCAVTQMACSSDSEANIDKAESIVRQAAAQGAQIILLQELFSRLYFCQEQKAHYFTWAEDAGTSLLLQRCATA